MQLETVDVMGNGAAFRTGGPGGGGGDFKHRNASGKRAASASPRQFVGSGHHIDHDKDGTTGGRCRIDRRGGEYFLQIPHFICKNSLFSHKIESILLF